MSEDVKQDAATADDGQQQQDDGKVSREVVDRFAKQRDAARAELQAFKDEVAAKAKEAERAKMDEVERLKADLAEEKARVQRFADKFDTQEIEHQITLLAQSEGAQDVGDVLALINRDGISRGEGGKLEGVAEAVAALKERKAYLFGQQAAGQRGVGAAAPPDTRAPRDEGEGRRGASLELDRDESVAETLKRRAQLLVTGRPL